MIFQTILGILIGIMPECIFTALIIRVCKHISIKKIILLAILFTIGASISWALFFGDIKFQFFWLVSSIIFMFIVLKCHISDIFIITTSLLLLTIFSIPAGIWFEYYWIIFCINRVFILAFPFLFRKFIQQGYNGYLKIWSTESGLKITSLTLRMISVASFNLLCIIFFISIIWRFILIGG